MRWSECDRPKDFLRVGALNLDKWTEITLASCFFWSFEWYQNIWQGPLLVIKLGVSNVTQNARACSGKQRIRLSWKKKKKPAHFGHSSRIYLCVFLVIRDSLQQIINNGTNYQSTLVVLKRLQEYIRKKRPETLAWQVDSLPFQWSCRWWIRFTWVPG